MIWQMRYSVAVSHYLHRKARRVYHSLLLLKLQDHVNWSRIPSELSLTWKILCITPYLNYISRFNLLTKIFLQFHFTALLFYFEFIFLSVIINMNGSSYNLLFLDFLLVTCVGNITKMRMSVILLFWAERKSFFTQRWPFRTSKHSFMTKGLSK